MLEQESQQEKAADQKNREGQCQYVEILVDKHFDGRAEFPDQERDKEKPGAAADDGSDKETEQVDIEYAGGNREHLVGQRRKSGGKNHPEIIFVVQSGDSVIYFVGKTRNVFEKEIGESCKLPVAGHPDKMTQRISGNSPRYGGCCADSGITK